MAGMRVAELEANKPDSAGEQVITIYARRPPDYAVYQTKQRVVIHYADDEALEKTQRNLIAQLNPVRGEINSAIDGWRSSTDPKWHRKAASYDRKVADALIVALEGDGAGALTMLEATRKDILEERTSRARFTYLIVGSTAAAVLIALATVCQSLFPRMEDLLLASAVGSVGAFFSIAVAIRSRTILADLRFRDNSIDASLRLVIGAIAAALLLCLVKAKAIDITLGIATLNPTNEKVEPWLYILIVAFIGGFSERLVPDLLAKASLTAPNAAPQPLLPPRLAVAANTVPQQSHDPAESADHCLCNLAAQPHEATPDTELPAATGGVAAR